ncbi:type II secretion system protein [bacterium]|nr:type II secretion system protein [bacterium]
MSKPQGFSLLEVVLAAFLVSCVVVSLMGVWPAYARAAEQNRAYLAANFLARQEMEYAINQGYIAVANRTSDVTVRAILAGITAVVDYRELSASLFGRDIRI